MKVRGEDISDALRTWIKNEIASSTSQRYDIGKFGFMVSSSTIGLFVGTNKLSSQVHIGFIFYSSLIILFCSVFLALLLTTPIFRKINSDTDLLTAHNRENRKTQFLIYFWFIAWLIGSILAIFNLFSN